MRSSATLGLVLLVSLGCGSSRQPVVSPAANESLKEQVTKDGKRIVWTEVNGQTEGIHRVFYSDGKLARETEYKQGKRNGRGRAYWEDGSLQFVAEYVNDVEVSGENWEKGQRPPKTQRSNSAETK